MRALKLNAYQLVIFEYLNSANASFSVLSRMANLKSLRNQAKCPTVYTLGQFFDSTVILEDGEMNEITVSWKSSNDSAWVSNEV